MKHREEDADDEKKVPHDRIKPHMKDLLTYYYGMRNDFPTWYEFVSLLVLLQPSSAAAERVFSQLSGIFSKQQGRLLQSGIWVAIALL